MSHDCDCFGREPCGERYCRRCNTCGYYDDDDDDDDTPTGVGIRPVLRVSRPTFQANMNWTASPSTAWTDAQIDGILKAAWEALDIDGLDIEITEDVAPQSAWVVGGDDGENDAAILRRWDAAVDAAAGGAA